MESGISNTYRRYINQRFIIIKFDFNNLGWLAQFYGHGVHEKRSPALKDNLFQALLIAPLFIVMEVLALFGYKQAFFKSIEPAVQAKIIKFRESLKKKN